MSSEPTSRERTFFYRMKLWPRVKHASTFATPNTPKATAFTNTASEESKALVLKWLARCMQDSDGNHDGCTKRRSDRRPTRLLYAREARRTSRLRLITTADISSSHEIIFAPLSYCWGAWGQEHDPVLTHENFAERSASGLAV
jgi:hypothetical protein